MSSTADQLSKCRVLIAHDWITTWAGSERCVEQMLEVVPHADLVVGVLSPDLRDLNAVTRQARETWLGRLPGAHRHHRWYVAVEGFAFATVDTRGYDLIISSSHAFSKMIRKQPGARHLCYCYSPPRYIWDLADTYRRDANALERLALSGGTAWLRWLDRRSVQGIDHFIGISHCVAERIERCYGRPAEVIHPPVAMKGSQIATHAVPGDFLLSLGRLVPYKRVDLAIAAAERAGVPLVIAGDGPDRTRLERLAGPHTRFVGAVSEEKAGRLLSKCRAFVFCGEEDFGIAPVEANAHGRPVVGFGKAGLLDTMVPGVTAELFAEQTVDAVTEAIGRVFGRTWSEVDLQRNAERFAPVHFRQRFEAAVRATLALR